MQEQSMTKAPIPAAGGVVYRWASESQLEILLIKKQGGFWTLPKGRIKAREDPRAAVAREVAEETSITGTVGEMVRAVDYSVQKGGRERLKTVTYYLVRAEAGTPQPQAKERIEYVRWFPVSAALRRIRRPRIRAVVRDARKILFERNAQQKNEP